MSDRIIQHKNHSDLPGNWRGRKIRYGAAAFEVELPCINGLAAWFAVATFHEAEEAERLMTDGARLEAEEYAERFANLATENATLRAELAEAHEHLRRVISNVESGSYESTGQAIDETKAYLASLNGKVE